MEKNPGNQPVNTPAITDIQVEVIYDEPEFYIRNKNGQCFVADNFYEIWQHFISDDGYRITFPLSDTYQMTIWREIYWNPAEIAEKNNRLLEETQYCNENAELIFREDGIAEYHFPNGMIISFDTFDEKEL